MTVRGPSSSAALLAQHRYRRSYVSACHARFSIMGWPLREDLGSTNGTAVNGRRITEPTVLKNNDVVNVGDVAIRVRYE
ncbi:MAG: FHA domain-containing protein [Slackia sp.]